MQVAFFVLYNSMTKWEEACAETVPEIKLGCFCLQLEKLLWLFKEMALVCHSPGCTGQMLNTLVMPLPWGGVSQRAASALYSAEIWALWVVNDTCFLFWQKQDLTLARTCRWAAWFPLLSDFSQGRSHCAMPVLGKHGLTCGSLSLCTPKLAPRLPWIHPWARTHV